MIEFIMGLFFWVSMTMGVTSGEVPKPDIVLLEPIQLAEIMCGKPEMCSDFRPAYYDGKKLYVLKSDGRDDIDYEQHKELASYIVHELVHHIQIKRIIKKNKKLTKEQAIAYEHEAIEIQKLYLSLVRS